MLEQAREGQTARVGGRTAGGRGRTPAGSWAGALSLLAPWHTDAVAGLAWAYCAAEAGCRTRHGRCPPSAQLCAALCRPPAQETELEAQEQALARERAALPAQVGGQAAGSAGRAWAVQAGWSSKLTGSRAGPRPRRAICSMWD